MIHVRRLPRGRRRLVPLGALVGVLLAVLVVGTSTPGPAQVAPVPPALLIDRVDATADPRITMTVSSDVDLLAAGTTVAVVEGRRVYADTRVEPLPTAGFEVVLALDVSGSMQGAAIAAAIQATQDFVRAMPGDVAIGLVTFGDSAVRVLPPTTDRAAVLDQVGALRAGGSTALYDGVRLAAETFTPGATRRAIVLLSDGGDTASAATLDAATGSLGGQTRLDVIELASRESNRPALDALAAAGGGSVQSGDDPAALDALYTEVSKRLLRRYTVTYRSARREATEATVRVASATGVATATAEIPDPVLAVDPIRDRGDAAAPDRAPAGTTSGRLWLAGSLLFAGIGTASSIVIVSQDRRYRVRRRIARREGPGTAGPVPTISSEGERGAAARGLALLLDAAGSGRTPGEYVVFTGLVALVAGVVGLVGFGPFGLVVGAMTVVGVAAARLRQRAARRRQAFTEQLSDTLKVLANMLRSGYGLSQALDVATEQVGDPMRTWIGQAVVEMRADRDVGEALRAVAARARSVDFEWVAMAVEINREIGGDLAEILDGLAETVRDRARIKGQVRALSAEGRLSAYVVLALPPTIMAFSALTNPGYVSQLTTGTGLVLVTIAVLLMIVGYVWMRRLVARVI
jgi:tight adherence protein B